MRWAWLVCLTLSCGSPAVDSATPSEGESSVVDTSASHPSSPKVIELDPDGPFAIPPTTNHHLYGEAVAVGSDLDKDGRLEWAVSAPHDANLAQDDVPVVVYEGTEVLTTILPIVREDAFPGDTFWDLAAGGDTDGDGFGELLLPEEWGGFGAYVRVVRSHDRADDILLMLPADQVWSPHTVAFQRMGEVDHPVVMSVVGSSRRFDRFDLSGVAPGSTLQATEATIIGWEERVGLMAPGYPVFADLDLDGVDELIYGTHESEYEVGETWVCPTAFDTSIPADCEAVSAGLSAGRFHEVGDLDGDGDLDIVAVASSTAGDDGEVWCLTQQGEVIAHIPGTMGNGIGSFPEYAVDDEGEAWLIVADLNSYSAEPTQAYRFRVSDLRGELTEADAETIWRTPGTSIGRQSAAYRETPASPLQLILTEPYHGTGHVYLVPWE